uniref:Uncharacterized protein n=1 Tax=Leersia perrieri TaxID=77586 RepID=A0A0D9VXG3_9ORYZ
MSLHICIGQTEIHPYAKGNPCLSILPDDVFAVDGIGLVAGGDREGPDAASETWEVAVAIGSVKRNLEAINDKGSDLEPVNLSTQKPRAEAKKGKGKEF